MSTTISFEHTEENFAHSNLTHGTDLGKARAFAEVLAPYTLARIDYVSVALGQPVDLGSIQFGAYGSIGLYAACKIRHVASNKLYEVRIFAPNAAIFDDHQELKTDIGELIATEYSRLAGEAFIFVRGALCGYSG